MQTPVAASLISAWVLFPAMLKGQGCRNLPPPDPSRNFIENFLTPCYQISLAEQTNNPHYGEDRNTTYSTIFYRVNPQYELILIGEYPQARYMSIVPYDDHLAIVSSLYDSQITPLPGYQNPYLPGGRFTEDQLYMAVIQLGGSPPATVAPGCDMNGANYGVNIFNASRRHPGISWNGVAGLPPDTPPHDDAGPSRGGQIEVRANLKQADAGNVQLSNPVILVRDLSTGCAVPASQALQRSYQPDDPQKVLTGSGQVAKNWLDQTQISTHQWYARDFQQRFCYARDPSNSVVWLGSKEYARSLSPNTGYLHGSIPQRSITTTTFMRLRFKMPVTPTLPCAGCSLTGVEQLRYWSLSFVAAGSSTLATLSDPGVVTDPDNNATVIVGFGAQPPAWVTASNYYTYMDLSGAKDRLPSMVLRTILPGGGFQCAVQNVPFNTMEYHPLGGYMGDYVPVADFVSGDAIPLQATPLPPLNSCDLTPPQPPQACP